MSAFSDAAVEIVKSIAEGKKAASDAATKAPGKGGSDAKGKDAKDAKGGTSNTTMIFIAILAFFILRGKRR